MLKKMFWMNEVGLLKIEIWKSGYRDSVSHSILRVQERTGSAIESGSRNFIQKGLGWEGTSIQQQSEHLVN